MTKRDYVCAMCGVSYKRMGHLTVHLRTHTGERPFKCPDCDKAFSRNDHLRDHIKRVHTQLKPFVCGHEGCPWAFAVKSDLAQHQQVHTRPKPYHCSQEGCTHSFRKKSELKKHLSDDHGLEKPYQCDRCDYRSSTPSELRTHVDRVHERRCKCDFPGCNAVFTKFKDLTAHKKQQHPRWKCPHCDRVLHKKDHYNHHLLTHLPKDMQPTHTCPHAHCGKSYSKRSNLQYHIKHKHSDTVTMHRCTHPGCKASYMHKHSLMKHMAQHEETKLADGSIVPPVIPPSEATNGAARPPQVGVKRAFGTMSESNPGPAPLPPTPTPSAPAAAVEPRQPIAATATAPAVSNTTSTVPAPVATSSTSAINPSTNDADDASEASDSEEEFRAKKPRLETQYGDDGDDGDDGDMSDYDDGYMRGGEMTTLPFG